MQSSEDLLKLLSDNSRNVLHNGNRISKYDVDKIVKKHILPYSFIPDTVTEAKSIISLSYTRVALDRRNSEVKNYLLRVKVYCHKDVWEIDGAIRVLIMAHEIDNQINGKYITSLGKVRFDIMQEIENTNGHYYGYEMYYSIGDFN